MDLSKLFSSIGDALSSVIGGIGTAMAAARRRVLPTKYGFQLRARIMPYSTCFSHSVANLLSAVGIEVSPDEVTVTVNSGEYQRWVAQNVQWATAYIGRLQTVWQVQERYLNQRLQAAGLQVRYQVVMTWATTKEFILEQIQAGYPVVTDTYPVYVKTGQKIGHIVAIVGYVLGYVADRKDFPSDRLYTQYVAKFGAEPRDCYIVDDPFGNMLEGYAGNDGTQPVIGDDLILPFQWFDGGIRGKFSLTLREKI